MVAYHDEEWGVPQHDERALFETLSLEAFVAGLSWATILAKRDAFRRAFANFEVERVARYNERSVARLLLDAGIVRHRAKIEATIANARAVLALAKAGEPFAEFVWSFAPKPGPRREEGTLARTEVSDALSKALRARGFHFVGSTTAYAFMQAAGLVNDHIATCFRARSLASSRR
jgi:DNA-3-methyladenine glycosylase I